jgi:hypothetical protein
MLASSRTRLAAAAITVLLVLVTAIAPARPGCLGSPGGAASGVSFYVTSVDDDGAGSLRRALTDANARPNAPGPDRILFAIPGSGVHTIALRSPLPAITDPVVVDGFSQAGARANTLAEARGAVAADGELTIVVDGSGAGDADGFVLLAGRSAIRGLEITGFSGSAVRIEGKGFNRIEGNVLGARMMASGPVERVDAGDADAPGDLASASETPETRGNGACGVTVIASTGNAVGGVDAASRNLIRANACAVRIAGAASAGNEILGNVIEANAEGIVLEGEDAPAARPEGSPDPGPNLRRAAPALTEVERLTGGDSQAGSSASDAPATIVSGRLASAPRTSFRVELFASDPDAPGRPARAASLGAPRSGRDGARLLATQTVTTEDDGGAALRFEVPLLLSGGTQLTATATDPEGNTSELSLPLLVPGRRSPGRTPWTATGTTPATGIPRRSPALPTPPTSRSRARTPSRSTRTPRSAG